MEYGTGLVPDILDERDYELDHILMGSPIFDWEKGYDIEEEIGMEIPTKSQNGSGSCVGQTSATYIWVKNVVEAVQKYGKLTEQTKQFFKEYYQISAKAVYSQIHLEQGGAYSRDAMMLWRDWGAVREKEVPSYDNGNPPSEEFMRGTEWMNKTLYPKTLQSFEARMLRDKSIDAIAQAIRDNHGIHFGVRGEWNNTWKSMFPLAPQSTNFFYHALYAGKANMINGKKYIGIKNSWGDNVGQKGWQWLSEEWFPEYVMNPWVAFDQANSGLLKFIDKKGKPRKLPAYWIKSIAHLMYV